MLEVIPRKSRDLYIPESLSAHKAIHTVFYFILHFQNYAITLGVKQNVLQTKAPEYFLKTVQTSSLV